MLRSEFAMLFRRRRIQVMLAVLAILPIIVIVALRLTGSDGGDSGDGPSFFNQVTQNGVFATLAALTVCFPFFLPMAVSIVSGDAIASEANLGTLRYLLIRPVERGRLIRVKAIVAASFCFIATGVVAISGLICGLALFPIGRVTTLSGTTIPLTEGIARMFGAVLAISISLMGLAAIGLYISTLTDAPVGAIASTLGVFILVGVLGTLPQLKWLHPWLFVDDWDSYADLLRGNIVWDGIRDNFIRQSVYVIVFISAAWANFTSKDVLG